MEIGLGTSQMRSLGRRVPVSGVADLLAAAARVGVRYIDTADTYGAGSAERSLSAAVRAQGRGRGSFRVITKIGYRTPDLPGVLRVLNQPAKKVLHRGGRQSFEPAYLARAWAASRRRLADLEVHACCLHNPPVAVLEDGSALLALAGLRDAGGFRLLGVSVDDDEAAAVLPDLASVELVELPARTWMGMAAKERASLLTRGVEVVVNRVTALDRDPVIALGLLRDDQHPPTVAVVGTRSPTHLVADAEAVRA